MLAWRIASFWLKCPKQTGAPGPEPVPRASTRRPGSVVAKYCQDPPKDAPIRPPSDGKRPRDCPGSGLPSCSRPEDPPAFDKPQALEPDPLIRDRKRTLDPGQAPEYSARGTPSALRGDTRTLTAAARVLWESVPAWCGCDNKQRASITWTRACKGRQIPARARRLFGRARRQQDSHNSSLRDCCGDVVTLCG